MDEKIRMLHGSGGEATSRLIKEIIAAEFGSNAEEDAAVVTVPTTVAPRIAMTTDSFVVTPCIYPGGDIGRLSVCGTVNDLLCRGAVPKFLTCGMILEEGFSVDTLKKISHSMAETAKEAGVRIVAGDTKVVEGRARSGQSPTPDTSPAPVATPNLSPAPDTTPAAVAAGVARNSNQAPVATLNPGPAPDPGSAPASGIFINTAGIGFVPAGTDISAAGAKDGDSIIVTGFLGDHHAAIMGTRLGMDTEFQSDNAPLVEIAEALRPFAVHTLRDVTRGGLATALSELAEASGKSFVIEEERLPVSPAIRDFCGILGLDPLYMGNEGKLVIIVDNRDEERALQAVRSSRYGENAAVIGKVSAPEGIQDTAGSAFLKTSVGGFRRLSPLRDEGLPRIC